MPDYSLYQEQELLSFLAGDDQFAFDELYKRFWKLLFGVAYRHTRDIQISEDIVHDVFASLWVNRHQIQAKKLKSYLAVSVKYLVLHKIRRDELLRKYREQMDKTVLSTNPEQDFRYKMMLELLQDEVEKLPEKCQIVFRYSREMGLSADEIATALHISPNTVKNHLVRAIKQIRNGLRDSLQSLFSLF